MSRDYQGDIAAGLADELLAVIHKYDETLLIPTVIGCLEIVKMEILADVWSDEDEEDEE